MKSDRPLVIVPTDFSKASRETLREAYAFAERIGADVDLVHAKRRPKPLFPRSKVNRDTVAEIDRTEVGEALEHLEKLARSARVRVHPRLLRGDASTAIAAHAKKRRAEFIVIGTTGHSAASSFFLGSTTDRVLRIAPCPVVVIPYGRDHDATA